MLRCKHSKQVALDHLRDAIPNAKAQALIPRENQAFAAPFRTQKGVSAARPAETPHA